MRKMYKQPISEIAELRGGLVMNMTSSVMDNNGGSGTAGGSQTDPIPVD